MTSLVYAIIVQENNTFQYYLPTTIIYVTLLNEVEFGYT